MDLSSGSCNACDAANTSFMKFSLVRYFFGRPYYRLSPSSDQSPKWYCETSSMQKNLQRDFRDIRAEYDKLAAGQSYELSKRNEFRRASLRLREIFTLLNAAEGHPPFLTDSNVTLLMERLKMASMRV
jgi:hypothetical protein